MGKQIAEYYQNVAFKNLTENLSAREVLINKLTAKGRTEDIEKELAKIPQVKVAKALAYLEGQDMEDYLHDMNIAQFYAQMNREAMADIIMEEMKLNDEDESFTTIHNYIDMTTKILRKGAISAKLGEKMLIPINMRDGSLICIGKGNDDWNQSAPHGAGRIYSRSKAKEVVSMEDYEKSMEGIYTTSVCKGTIDESPMVYKPMQEILDNITDTVDVVERIVPVYNFKASEDSQIRRKKKS